MNDDLTPLTGRCMCGAVEVSSAAPFVGALFCHCKRCQRRSGTTRSMTALRPEGAFSVTAGDDKVRVWDPGDGWLKAFCVDCGSHTHTISPDDPTLVAIRLGVPRPRSWHPPAGASDPLDQWSAMDDFREARWYGVRPAANRKPATYRCPLCGGPLPALRDHMLVLPDGDPSRRRHAHTECVMNARRDGRLLLREEVEPRRPGLLSRLLGR